MLSCQGLSNIYGDFSVAAIISRWENFPFDENNFVEPNKKFDEPDENVTDILREIESEQKDSSQPTKQQRIITGSVDKEYFPPSVQRNKFFPVNIASSKDWMELRAEVLDLHELKNFFIGKSDSQSPQFMNSIETYRRVAEKELATPQEINADSSNIFVATLADVIEKRLYKILTTCRYGKDGRGELSPGYYLEIEQRVEKYFERIGLHSEKIRRLEDFNKWVEVMKAESIPVSEKYRDKKIAEVEIQPRYFEYHNDAGEVEKYYIEGRCKYYKF